MFLFLADKCPYLFTLKVHHGGDIFKEKGIVLYVDDKVDFYDWVNKDYLSLKELDGILKTLGYVSKPDYYYMIPGHNDENAFIHIQKHSDLFDMFKFAEQGRVVNLFCYEHLEPLNFFFFFKEEEVPFEHSQTQLETQNETGAEIVAEFEAQADLHNAHI